MKRLLPFSGSLVIAFAALTLYAQDPQATIGASAPPFELNGLDGNNYSIAQWKGKLIMIHFATTWCPFCNAEAPNLELLYQSYKDKGVQVLLIDVKESKELVAQSLQRFAFSFPVLLDPNGKVAASYAPAGVLPDLARDEVVVASNVIIDREGKIRFFSLLNTASFDAKLTEARKKLDELLAQRVDVSVNETVAVAGKKSVVNVRVMVKEGYHIQADTVNDASLIPVTFRTTENEHFTIGNAIFPPCNVFRLEGTKNDLNVFDSSFMVGLPILPSAGIKTGRYLIKAQLRYQACDAKTCLFPRTIDLELPIIIRPPSSAPPPADSFPSLPLFPPPASHAPTP
jgi:peroxiredoxin